MTLFCARYHCPASEFEEQALRRCLYWRARLLAPLIRTIQPRFFEPDFALIRYLGTPVGRRNAINELAAYIETIKARGGFARKILRFRVSARKTSDLIALVFERPTEPGADRSDREI